MHTWLELHVDDVVLQHDPSRWDESAALIDGVAREVENEGGFLSIRVREWFSGGDKSGFLRALLARGHEVGAHAHGRDLARSVRALAGAGVVSPVMAPGLVQVGVPGRVALLEQARALGATVVTDRVEARLFTYQGWLAWEPVPGLSQLDVSVSPFDWGVLHRRRGKVEPAFGRLDWEALDRLAATQAGWTPPTAGKSFFGATFHEHDLCEPGSLRPFPAAIAGLRRWVARWRPQPSLLAARVHAASPLSTISGPDAAAASGQPAGAKGGQSAVHSAGDRAVPRPGRVAPGSPKSMRFGPENALAALVVVHAGGSGLVEQLRFLGLSPRDLPDVAIWCFERTPGVPRAPGNPIHLADARAVIETALADGLPTVVLSWSGGCVPAATAIGDLRRCHPQLASSIRCFIDVEGPVDRFSLLPPGKPGHEWTSVSPHDEGHWRGLELVQLLPRLIGGILPPTPYLRLQGTPDHVHGECELHGHRAVEAARRAGVPAEYRRLGRPLREASSEIRELLVAKLGG